MGIPVKGFPRYTVDESGVITNIQTGKTVRGRVNNNGYRIVELFYETGKSKQLLLHRIVAEAFIPNPEGFPIINHKDENPGNNHVSNLEWCTDKYNIHYGTCQERRAKSMEHFYKSEKIKDQARENGKAVSRPVVQMTKSGEIVATFPSIIAASRSLDKGGSQVCEVCKGKRKSAGGFVWAYREE